MSRTALVTGAGQNIGRAVALALAADGMNVVVNGQTNRAACDETAELVRAAGREAVVAMGDCGVAGDCRRMVEAGVERFGRIDVLVHNAAIRPLTPFLDMSEDDWRRTMDVNLTASFWLAQAVLPGMVDAGWGRIVLFAGMNAIHGYSGRAHVSVSKHGNWGLAKALGKEFGPKGITTNIVSPGPIASEHADRSMTDHINAQVGRIPVGRLGTPEEVAATVALLASEKGAFINGQLVQVNGGAET